MSATSLQDGRPRCPEDDELEEADALLAELRRQADAGEESLAWGDEGKRTSCWGEDGVLRATRQYSATTWDSRLLVLTIQELPYAAHPCAGGASTGGVVWAGALALIKLLTERRAALFPDESSHRILEIGAGCGLSGLAAAALAGPRARTWLTDENEVVLENLRWNVEANADCLGCRVEVSRLCWEEMLEGTSPPPVQSLDLVLGSDVIWGDRGSLVGSVAMRLVRPGGYLAISAQQGREGLDVFEATIRKHGIVADPQSLPFDVEVLHTEVAGEAIVNYVCRRHSSS